jgi:hypothetical protein
MVIALSLAVAGCTPSVKSSSPNHVTVESYQMDVAKAQQLADAECAKYNRRAKMTLKATPGEEERDYIFACID